MFTLLETTNLGVYAIAGVSSVYSLIRNFIFTPLYGAHCLGVKKSTFYHEIITGNISLVINLIISFAVHKMFTVNSWIVLIFVCITYNHEKYIRDALESFLMQKTNFKYEIIVHDDASTDQTPQIIKEYAEKYPNIIVPILQTKNQYSQGIKIAATYIWPRARGKYIKEMIFG